MYTVPPSGSFCAVTPQNSMLYLLYSSKNLYTFYAMVGCISYQTFAFIINKRKINNYLTK